MPCAEEGKLLSKRVLRSEINHLDQLFISYHERFGRRLRTPACFSSPKRDPLPLARLRVYSDV